MLTHFLYGLVVSYLGSIAPGVLNLNAIDVSIKQGVRQSIIFSMAVACIEFLQASIGVSFSHYLSQRTHILDALEMSSIPLFLIIGIVFWLQKPSDPNTENTEQKNKQRPFTRGFVLSLANMLAIPYWVAWTVYSFAWFDWFQITWITGLPFVLGVSLGTMSCLITYGILSNKIKHHLGLINLYMSKIIGTAFIGIACMQCIKHRETIFSWIF